MPSDQGFKDFLAARTAATSSAAGDVLPIVQGGATKKIDANVLGTSLLSGLFSGRTALTTGTLTATHSVLVDDGTTTSKATLDTVRQIILTDANVSALTSVSTNTSNIAALQSTVAALNTAGGLIGTQGPGSVLTNSTTDTQLSNYAADATNNLAAGDKFAKLTVFTIVNTSGSPVNVTIKEKIAAANTFQWITYPFASLAGGSYTCWLYTEYTVGQSTPNTDHRQFSWLQVMANVGGTQSGSASSITYAGVAPTAFLQTSPLGYLSAGSDYLLTQPQIEARFAFSAAATTISMQRIESALSFIKA